MKKKSKQYRAFKFERDKIYPIQEALQLIMDHKTAKFDESVDVAVSLGVDTQQSNQQVRGTCFLPHGLAKPVRVIVFAKGEQEQKAKEAQADAVGSEDLAKKIKEGWLDFDRVIATPDQMPVVSRVAQILGPRGLMPNPKLGTVTPDVFKAVEAEKKGKAFFKANQSGKIGLVHSSIGRRSLGLDKLKDNYFSFISELVRLKPPSSKGNYLRQIIISSTMGPALHIDVNEQLN